MRLCSPNSYDLWVRAAVSYEEPTEVDQRKLTFSCCSCYNEIMHIIHVLQKCKNHVNNHSFSRLHIFTDSKINEASLLVIAGRIKLYLAQSSE